MKKKGRSRLHLQQRETSFSATQIAHHRRRGGGGGGGRAPTQGIALSREGRSVFRPRQPIPKAHAKKLPALCRTGKKLPLKKYCSSTPSDSGEERRGGKPFLGKRTSVGNTEERKESSPNLPPDRGGSRGGKKSPFRKGKRKANSCSPNKGGRKVNTDRFRKYLIKETARKRQPY